MTTIHRKAVTIIAFLLILLFGPVQAMADIVMGVFPRRNVATTHKDFQPLANYLSDKLGEPVKLIVPMNFNAFWDGVQNKQFDLVHFNQYHYIKSHQEQGYKVIVANEEFGSKQISGALTVRKDSGISSITELKDKTILFGGGKRAMGSYIAPIAILKQNGLKAGIDYKIEFAKNPPSAVIGVYHKLASAAGSGNVILKIKGINRKIDVSQLTILAESEPFAQLPWAVKDNMSESKMKAIQTIMTSLNTSDNGHKILKSAKVTGFHLVTDKDYAKVREITKYAIDESY